MEIKFTLDQIKNLPIGTDLSTLTEEQIENAKKIVIPHHPYNKARIGLMVDSHDFNVKNMMEILS